MALGRRLHADVLEEIAQEVFQGLISPTRRRKFEVQRGSIWKFLLGELCGSASGRFAILDCPGS